MKTGTIYKIISENSRKIYIGSTTMNEIRNRLWQSQSMYRAWLKDKTKPYRNVFRLLKHGDAEIIKIKKVKYNHIDELRIVEQHYIKKYTRKGITCLNKNKAFRLGSGYSKIEYMEHYRKIKYKCKECGSVTTLHNRTRHRKTDKHIQYVARIERENINK